MPFSGYPNEKPMDPIISHREIRKIMFEIGRSGLSSSGGKRRPDRTTTEEKDAEIMANRLKREASSIISVDVRFCD